MKQIFGWFTRLFCTESHTMPWNHSFCRNLALLSVKMMYILRMIKKGALKLIVRSKFIQTNKQTVLFHFGPAFQFIQYTHTKSLCGFFVRNWTVQRKQKNNHCTEHKCGIWHLPDIENVAPNFPNSQQTKENNNKIKTVYTLNFRKLKRLHSFSLSHIHTHTIYRRHDSQKYWTQFSRDDNLSCTFVWLICVLFLPFIHYMEATNK